MLQFKPAPYNLGFKDALVPLYKTKKGLSREIILAISKIKNEPVWMREKRLAAYDIFQKKTMPKFGPSLSGLNLEEIYYYAKPAEKSANWNEVPQKIKKTFEKIGIPEIEQKFLAGVGAQYDSEIIYQRISKMLAKKGVIFCDTETAVKKYPRLFKKYFGTVVPPNDNKFAALNSAVWSGGSFIYVPPKVRVSLPLQAYFRINTSRFGQFERTLIIADRESEVFYIEGCSAPIYNQSSLHAAVVEIIVGPRAHVRYTTVQNWSKNVYNLVTKRMFVGEEGFGEWIDVNLGSCVTMKYPSLYLKGRGARGEILSLVFAGKGQNQDVGGKVFHLAPQTSSVLTSKALSSAGGQTSYRGLVRVVKGARGSRGMMRCHNLILDKKSQAQTFPSLKIDEKEVNVGHEAYVSKISEEQLFYLQSRGIGKDEAEAMIINGFVEPVVRQLPLEYAVELNRFLKLEVTGG